MGDLIWLSQAQMRRIEPYFLLSHGVPRVDDRRIISGIIFVIRNRLRWRDAPAECGPPKTIYNRFIRWSRLGVFNKIFAGLAALDQSMIDATHLKAHRTAASLLGDRSYDADGFRAALADRNITACIPSKASRKIHITHDVTLDRQRHKIEIMFGRLKDW